MSQTGRNPAPILEILGLRRGASGEGDKREKGIGRGKGKEGGTFLPLSSASFMEPTDFLAMVIAGTALVRATRAAEVVGVRREGEKVEERATCAF